MGRSLGRAVGVRAQRGQVGPGPGPRGGEAFRGLDAAVGSPLIRMSVMRALRLLNYLNTE